MKCDQRVFEAKNNKGLEVHIRVEHEHDETKKNMKCDQCDFEAKKNRGVKIY